MNTSATPVLFSSLALAQGRQIGIATLNAEKTLNALSIDMVRLLQQQLQAWDRDSNTVMMVLQGAGDKALCAGGDLQQLYRAMQAHHASPQRDDPLANPLALEFFEQEYRLDYQIHSLRKPLLCWGHGIVMGGGIGLMAGASHRVVTESARLAMPETAIGLFPDVGGTWFLNRMPGRLGLFLALTGASINAADALFIKLADVHLPHAAKTSLFASLQEQCWSDDIACNHRLLSHVLQASAGNFSSGENAAGPLRRHFDLINRLCSSASLEQNIAAISEAGNDDPYLQKAAANIRKACPASMRIAHALQERGKHLSLAQVFRLELNTALRCTQAPDFAEGIRALLIDKDLMPRWQTASHSRSDSAWQDDFFRSLWPPHRHPLRDLDAEEKAIAA
ncbi:MAG: enoyl-CoA hydratase/isomerase family protein [Burkholderiales bacterium]|nr:enoyl-CoA hydratase/isomerase family protein [Burkholderiales bacterium]